jgi:hypothetical protein
LCLKITVMVSWFGAQNQAGYGLLVAPQNRWENDDGLGHASRYSGLLRVKASRARVFQFSLKTGGGATRMVHLTSMRRLRQGQVEDRRVDTMNCVGPCYPCFIVFYVLGFRVILIF